MKNELKNPFFLIYLNNIFKFQKYKIIQLKTHFQENEIVFCLLLQVIMAFNLRKWNRKTKIMKWWMNWCVKHHFYSTWNVDIYCMKCLPKSRAILRKKENCSVFKLGFWFFMYSSREHRPRQVLLISSTW